ncbi:MAG: glycosyltransferase family 4 protein [Cytophagales bacterium]|nr:glycosyltransferase family 4 protein [Cytophagales bacterium]MCA6387693.1 glycosyltransferase family 4 protein [Cytophagales bacterium]MCA6393362.1 glycosyltransferase family 4 protein [Cytophagales bacterium]MCA6398773.1 glycosyltransferase family 4 protein [Cytophagales bacterium]MCA6403742.1 glycosyltransferase family 4 protein [Cytophagales bacterium]
MKRILVISFSDLNHDARVSRQVDFIKDNYLVTVAAYGGQENKGYELIPITKTKFTFAHKLFSSFFLLTRWHGKAYSLLYQLSSIEEALRQKMFDLIIANDVESLPFAFSLKTNAKIIFDAHEYAPRHFEDRLTWRIFFQPFNIHLCKKYIPQVDAMITVGKGLANEYEKNFGVRPTIITNATWYSDIKPSKIVDRKVRLIHHGGSTPSRKLELMIEMMTYLDDRFTLDLMLIVPQLASAKTSNYINTLKQLAANDDRIRFLSPLRSNELVSFLNQYDIGVFLLPPVNFNYANTLPNKLFDFIQARLAIAIGPTPEMAEIVNHYDIGVVAENFTAKALADKLSTLTTERLNGLKLNAEKAAIELTAERNKEKLEEIIGSLLGPY